ncbi:DUF742 domain-containing protein [Egibacter rhizosphaerae]|uniref:DUF742 domain-containing protein n=1 Tax=Egibacter rhizosphaerae TaxID=1670831 RepID=A0A411YKI9_9ACTN|nr:DUF742 domain-containing protein [Egibacter rhizosphaerae]QBI21729.1 DUF742 domain-containing protein [Egibacter rhizosphaerae]
MNGEPERPDGAEQEPRLARPYMFVGGRTRARGPELRLETPLRPTLKSPAGAESPSARRVLDACLGGAGSVAELAGALGMPIGVVRVLASDLVADGVLEAAATPSTGEGPMDDVHLLRRVLADVERL